MGLFNFLRKKTTPLTEEERLDRLWELWEIGDLKAPCAQLMTYEAEVNNGGHGQYFFNIANTGDLKTEIDIILPMLPQLLRENLERGYRAFIGQDDISDDVNEELFEECDSVFYENKRLLIDVLKSCANSLLK